MMHAGNEKYYFFNLSEPVYIYNKKYVNRRNGYRDQWNTHVVWAYISEQ